MEQEIKIIIPIEPVTKKNSSEIIYNKSLNRAMLIPSKRYRQYEKDCYPYLIRHKHKISQRCNIKCVYYMKTHRRVDLANLLNATLDVFVKYGVIEDDNCSVACTHDGSIVRYDKFHPRTEITISIYDEEEIRQLYPEEFTQIKMRGL